MTDRRTGIGCRNLEVHVGGRQLLHVSDLHVSYGHTLAVLGPNGAGKSTLLRALGMLTVHRVSGEVLLDDRSATRSQMREAVAAVLQRPILRRGTVIANATSGLRFRGVNRRAARERATAWLEALGVDQLARRDVRTLSGGEAQRVSIARALAVGPRVLLLDEPFTGLDATTRTDLLADLRAALSGQPTATILVTHDRHDAAALAENTALLINGQIRQQGPTTDVLDNPADLDTARLLGFVNLLPPALTGAPHTLVARPEHSRLLLGSTDRPENGITVTGTLHRTVPLGVVTRIDVDTASGSLTCLHTGDLPAGATPPVGSTVVIAIHETRIPRCLGEPHTPSAVQL